MCLQRRGLQQLNDAGIVAILDHHALPGVQDALQMFTGRFVVFPMLYERFLKGTYL